MSKKQVYILDTTLRDGQQSPGAGMSFEDNLAYAEIANKLKIDVLEAGFPSASNTDFEIVNQISKRMAAINSEMIISSLCQLREDQVLKTMEALEPSLAISKARIHIYVPVDPELMGASLGKLAEDKPKIIETVYRLIKIMTDKGFEVEFSPEGFSRQRHNFSFVEDVIRASVKAGATVINCPDTIGGASALEGEEYFVNKMAVHKATIDKEFPNNNVIWSMHCHNDFGLAVQNSLNGVFSGVASQIEGCINGVGERAGNAALEQCIMIIRQFGEKQLADQYYTNINIKYLKEASDFIAERMLPRQPHSPIVGGNAANHTSGGHTNAILKNPLSYQPFDPIDVGSEITFAFGPLSGSNHAQQIIVKNNYLCDDSEKVIVCQAIKDFYADRRKGVTDSELMSAYYYHRSPAKITKIKYSKGEDDSTDVKLAGEFFSEKDLVINYHGRGSALSALNEATAKYMDGLSVIDYNSKSKGISIDAICESHIIIEYKGIRYSGAADDEDIELSALKAFINAVNNAYIEDKFKLN
ncbi:MAG: alpha-isopropylmalate synthase regulatory domain-containing protein [Burkholderiales bacterium]|nr:alpha-isopropylmalate synthase regulatory domain-containing protein [Burkholderiales bacterium]